MHFSTEFMSMYGKLTLFNEWNKLKWYHFSQLRTIVILVALLWDYAFVFQTLVVINLGNGNGSFRRYQHRDREALIFFPILF